jgi:outer membrane protein OmpA-like peptidoglycan-associated protein
MQIKRRYLILGLLPVFAVGALATGFHPLPWQLFERQSASSTQKTAVALQSSVQSKVPARPAEPAKPAEAVTNQLPAPASARVPATAASSAAKKMPSTGIDVARINPDGASVIAGHAKPSSRITVMADGNPVGAITADRSGDWVMVTMQKFANPDAKLTIKPGDHTIKKVAALVTPGTSSDAPKAAAPRRTAAQVTRQMMQRLETLTREASANDPAKTSKPSAAPPATASPVVSPSVAGPSTVSSAPAIVAPNQASASAPPVTTVKPAQGAPSKSSPAAAPVASRPVVVARAAAAMPAPQASLALTSRGIAVTPSLTVLNTQTRTTPRPSSESSTGTSESGTRVAAVTVPKVASASPAATKKPDRPSLTIKASVEPLPVPVQFIYRKDVFTEYGRQAASLLLKYFLVKKFSAVWLSGHADERGTAAANQKLSRERLQRIEKFLRNGGFAGKLTLIPKGATEIYKGVDRSKFPQEELWQLDRRVEVVAAK